MIDASNVKKGQTGFVIHEFKAVPVTVSSIEDISYHGTSCYQFHCKEINNESFWTLYTMKEAYEKLLQILLKSKQTIQENLDKEKQKKRFIKNQINELKIKLKDLNDTK